MLSCSGDWRPYVPGRGRWSSWSELPTLAELWRPLVGGGGMRSWRGWQLANEGESRAEYYLRNRALGRRPSEPPSTAEDSRLFENGLVLVGRVVGCRRLLPGQGKLTAFLLQVPLQGEVSSPADPSPELPGRRWPSSEAGCSPDWKVRYVLVVHFAELKQEYS